MYSTLHFDTKPFWFGVRYFRTVPRGLAAPGLHCYSGSTPYCSPVNRANINYTKNTKNTKNTR